LASKLYNWCIHVILLFLEILRKGKGVKERKEGRKGGREGEREGGRMDTPSL